MFLQCVLKFLARFPAVSKGCPEISWCISLVTWQVGINLTDLVGSGHQAIKSTSKFLFHICHFISQELCSASNRHNIINLKGFFSFFHATICLKQVVVGVALLTQEFPRQSFCSFSVLSKKPRWLLELQLLCLLSCKDKEEGHSGKRDFSEGPLRTFAFLIF